MKRLPPVLFLGLALASGCGDDSKGDGDDVDDPDAEVDEPDAEEPDAAPPDHPQPTIVSLSTTGNEALFAVTWGADGKIYATGFTTPGLDNAADRSLIVARFSATGVLDDTFGTGGVATVNVAPDGRNGEVARGIVVLADGKVVIAGSIEHDVAATGAAGNDRDIAIVRLDADGTPDETFGGGDGIVIHDIGTGVVVTNPDDTQSLVGADAVWNIATYPGDKLIVAGATRADGRNDTDWLLLRLNADGSLDNSFSGDGQFRLDIDNVNASARAATVLADGSILHAGYANTPTAGGLQPVVYKVDGNGELVTTFGNFEGYFHDAVLAGGAEAYGAAVHADGKIVTIGYGKVTSAAANDWISIRLSAEGELDGTWNNDGALTVDVGGFSDQGRFALALPDGNTLFTGSGTPAEGATDAMIGVFDAAGQPVTDFGPNGRRIHDLGGVSDAMWGAAISPDGGWLAIVGAKGAGSGATATNNDESAILLLPLE